MNVFVGVYFDACVIYFPPKNKCYISVTIIIIDFFSNREVTGHVARTGERRCVYRVFVGKPGGKRTLGRPRH
jgi:hypothetical protein